MDWGLRRATRDDVASLAELKRQLIADEGSRNPMTLSQLAARMADFLATGWEAVAVTVGGEVIGYCLFQSRKDEYFPARAVVYVRQYVLRRDYRGAGLGRAAFERIVAEFFPPDTAEVALEVLVANRRGEHFWRSLGFAAQSVALRREVPPVVDV